MKTNDLQPAQAEAPGLKLTRLERTLALLQGRITLLEEENATFAAMLKERGVNARPSSRIALELPPPAREPLAAAAGLGLMTAAERGLLDDLRGGAPVFVLARTDSRTDVGQWLRQGRIWAAAAPQDLILLAAGRRPFVWKAPFTRLRESLYNHVTGELVPAPVWETQLPRLIMPPLDGYQLLAQIYAGS